MDRRIGWLVTTATLVALSGCSDGGSDPVGPGGTDPGSQNRSGLRALDDDEAFFTELRGALVAQHGGGDFATDGGIAEDSDAVAAPTTGGTLPPAAPPAAPGTAEGGGAGDDGGRLEVTGTNVQEQGVDEQDRVKVSSDGSRLYVLQQDFGGGSPPFPIDDVATDEEPATAPDGLAVDPLPGSGADRRSTLRVLGLDAASADATPLRDIELDLGGRNADGMYLYESEAGSRVLLSSSGGGYWGYWDSSAAFGGLDSVVTRIDVDDPATAEITGSFRIDGQIVSSRRIGKYLFFASRFYPTLPGPQPWELTPGEWEAAVQAADDDSLLPAYVDEATGERTALVDPGGCFVADRSANQPWYTPDIVTLAVIDLDTMALSDSECYLGASETLYASPEAVYLATTRYDYGAVPEPTPVGPPVIVEGPDDSEPEPGVEPEPAFLPTDPVVETDIHQFDIDGGSLAYRGSGTVPGHLGFDSLRKPFRMSARNGVLRVATVNDTFGFDGQARDISPINVSVLAPDGEGALERLAQLPNAREPGFIGKPGEQLYASRFIGDRAYLVTFRQTDPLYVVDLADPRNPRVLGELEIEGYSDYLMPIDENTLLGIGRDAVADPRGDERGGLVLGLKLSLFDVSDPTAPGEVDTLLVGQTGTRADALFDHRGITVQPATDDHPTRVSFGIDVHGQAFPTTRPDPGSNVGGPAYYEWSYTGLHGFDVRGGDAAGIEPRGAMIVEQRGQDDLLFGPSVYGGDRSVMVNEATYYVHGDRVYAATWDTLQSPSEAR